MGENTLALLEYLTSPATVMGNSPTATKLPKSSRTADTIFFSGLGGHLFLMYSRAQATLIYGVLASLAAIVVGDRVEWSRKGVYLAAVLGTGGSFLAAVAGANLAAVGTAVVMGKTMTWYVALRRARLRAHLAEFRLIATTRFHHEALPVLVFGPPAALAVLLFQGSLSSVIRTTLADPLIELAESSLLEHATLIGQLVYYTTLLLVGHALGVGSSYLLAIQVVALLAALIINDYILKPRGRSVHLATYVVLQVCLRVHALALRSADDHHSSTDRPPPSRR